MKSSEINRLKEIIQPLRRKIFIKYRSRFGEDLGGCCTIASGILFKHLHKELKGIKLVMSEDKDGFSHCFLIYKGYIIDVTATQFGHLEEIVIFKDDEKTVDRVKCWYWYGKRIEFKNVNELKRYQKKEKWPPEQFYWTNYYKKELYYF